MIRLGQEFEQKKAKIRRILNNSRFPASNMSITFHLHQIPISINCQSINKPSTVTASFSTQFASTLLPQIKNCDSSKHRDTGEKDYKSKKTSRCLYLRSTLLCLFIHSNSSMTLRCCLLLNDFLPFPRPPKQPQPCCDSDILNE